MKGIVADLVVGAHGENGLPRSLQRTAMNGAVSGPDISCFGIRLRPMSDVR